MLCLKVLSITGLESCPLSPTHNDQPLWHVAELTGLWSPPYCRFGQVTTKRHVTDSSTFPKQGTRFLPHGTNSSAANFTSILKMYTEPITALPSHQGNRVIRCKCWEQTDAECGQALLPMPVLSNSLYKSAKHLDRGVCKIRCALLELKHPYLGLALNLQPQNACQACFCCIAQNRAGDKNKAESSSIPMSSPPFLVAP